MKVILLKDIKKKGQKGSILDVSDGYANSFLIPRKMARVASESDILMSNSKTEYAQKKTAKTEQSNADLFNRINKKQVTITSNTNQSGHLFAAVKPTDITSLLPGLRPEHIVLKDNIKEVGDYEVPIKIGNNKGTIIAHITR